MDSNFSKQMDILERYPTLYERTGGDKGLTVLDGSFACGVRWYPILDRPFADLTVIQLNDVLTGLKVVQVKEKFGGLRVHVNGDNKRIEAPITEVETEAAASCEQCGGPNPGLRNRVAWYGNISDSCTQKRRSER